MYKSFEKNIGQIITTGLIKKNEPLANHTTFRIGGPADYFIIPGSIEELRAILALCKTEQIPYFILGNGSNVLAADEGFRGVVLQIGRGMDSIKMESMMDGSVKVTAGAGCMLGNLARQVANEGLEGFEFAAGIPGTLGGAVFMNAGAYGGEIKDCICYATLLNEDGELCTLSKEELKLGYRTSVVQQENYIVLEAVFSFQKGNKDEILEKINQFNRQRREKQPLEYPSAGSTFKRPEGYFAGKLIMDAGLRGYRVGDIMVSEKHCGFVINVGNGTAKDAKKLMEDVAKVVKEQFQVELEPEVRMLG